MSKKSDQSHQAAVLALAFSPDGTFLASGGDDTKVCLWDAATAKWLKTRPKQGHKWAITSVVFSPDNRKVIALSQSKQNRTDAVGDSEVLVWDIVTNGVIKPEDEGPHRNKPIRALAASESVGVLAAGWFLRKLDMAAGRFGKPLDQREEMDEVSALDACGPLVVSGHYDGTIRAWDLVTGDVTRTLGGNSTDASPATGAVVDALAALPETKLQDLTDVTAMAIHMAKELIAVGQADGTVRVENAKELLPET